MFIFIFFGVACRHAAHLNHLQAHCIAWARWAMAKITQALLIVTERLTSRSASTPALSSCIIMFRQLFADAFVQGDSEAACNLGAMHEFGYGTAAGLVCVPVHVLYLSQPCNSSAYPKKAFDFYWFGLVLLDLFHLTLIVTLPQRVFSSRRCPRRIQRGALPPKCYRCHALSIGPA